MWDLHLLSMGSWKVTCVAATAVVAAAVIVGLVRCSVVPLPSGGRLRLSDMALPYTGSLSDGREVTVPGLPADCWGRGPPSTGDRSWPPTPPRGADGDCFCWLDTDWTELGAQVPSAGRLLRGVVPGCDRATRSWRPVSYTISYFIKLLT